MMATLPLKSCLLFAENGKNSGKDGVEEAERSTIQIETLHSISQGVSADAEHFCGQHLIVVVFMEGHADKGLFQPHGEMVVDDPVMLEAHLVEDRLKDMGENRVVIIFALWRRQPRELFAG